MIGEVDPPLSDKEREVRAEARRRIAQAFNVPLAFLPDDGSGPPEGCPDCGRDTVVWSEDEGNYCSWCGWRP